MEMWRELKVGDQVRLVAIPPEFLREGYGIHKETMRLYKKLLARRRPLRVFQICDWGLPWIRCRFQRKNGQWEWHSLAINHGGLVRVKSRHRSTD